MSDPLKPFSEIPLLPLPSDAKPQPRPPIFNPYAGLLRLHESLGPIFRVQPPGLGYSVTYVSDPGVIRRVLEDEHDEFVKGPSTTAPFASIVPHHLIALDGSRHALLRRAALKGLTPARLERHAFPAAVRHSKGLVAGLLASLADGPVRDIDRRCRAFALDVISEVLFGESWLAQRDYTREGNAKAWALGELMYVLHWRITDFADTAWRQERYDGQGGELLNILETFVRSEIERHRRLLEAGTPKDDILTLLLEHSPQLDADELVSCCMTLLTMGHENVASAIAWTLVLLAENGDVQEDVRAEVRGFAAPSTYDSLSRMPRLTQAFEEAVRLCPSVPAVTRAPSRPGGSQVMGYHIPQGEELALNLYAVHRLEPGLGGVSGDQPMSFCPRRFEASSAPARDGPMPFGGGGRTCLGRSLAYVEARVAVAAVLSELELDIVLAAGAAEKAEAPRTRQAVYVSLRPWKSQLQVSKL